MRVHLIALILLLPVAATQGCATKDPAALAEEHAKTESDDDAACREKGAADSKAYQACRETLANARTQQNAVRYQKARDFDRVLGAGTDGQNGY